MKILRFISIIFGAEDHKIYQSSDQKHHNKKKLTRIRSLPFAVKGLIPIHKTKNLIKSSLHFIPTFMRLCFYSLLSDVVPASSAFTPSFSAFSSLFSRLPEYPPWYPHIIRSFRFFLRNISCHTVCHSGAPVSVR